MREDEQVRRGDVDGVPAFWPAEPDPERTDRSISVSFRVGEADETLPLHGITHLLEHLALFGLDREGLQVNGSVGATRTDFVCRGTPEELVRFTAGVTRALHDLPAERLETEKRVLRTEADGADLPTGARFRNWRYGPRGYGLGLWRELGLEWMTIERLHEWSAEWCTRGNAVLVLSHEPTPDLRLHLPDGPRRPRPEPVPIPELQHPCYVADGTAGVAIHGAPPWSPALVLALEIARLRVLDRLRGEEGLSYNATAGASALTPAVGDAVLRAGCLDEHAPRALDVLLRIVEDLAAEGPTPEELARELGEIEGMSAPPAQVLAEQAADDELFEDPDPIDHEAFVERVRAVGPREAAEAMRAFAASAIVLAPFGTPRPAGRMVDWRTWTSEPVEGRTFKRKRLAPDDEPHADLVVGPQGVSLRFDDGDVTVRFDRCVAVVRLAWGALSVQGDDDTAVVVSPDGRADGEEAVQAVLDAVPAELVVPGGDLPAGEAVARLADDLEETWAIRTPLRQLPRMLGREEHVEALAHAGTRKHNGLLAVTEHRLLRLIDVGGEPEVHEIPWTIVTEVEPAGGLQRSHLRVRLRDGEGEDLVLKVERKERRERVLAYAQERLAAVAAAVGGDRDGDESGDGSAEDRRLF